ncbi:hypothetical protein CJ030_MR6G006663 [Morella rubra]|uniref:Nuclear pore complex protein NUP133 n=1 Tax=Morella rubra TaxID=262757 RepID=A0A6A1V8D9_9ROSI|nr:hypothetical protein CJ030_MR6G006663 [Morella rubra]
MFSPGIKRPNASSRKERNQGHTVTPRSEARRSSLQNSVPDRPSTPAPWAPRLSVLTPRIPPGNRSEREDEADPIKPVYVGEFPQVVRDEEASLLQKRVPASIKCIVLELPSTGSGNANIDSTERNCWLVCVVNWDSTSRRTKKVVKHCNSAGIVLCNRKTRAIIYWPEVYSEITVPVISLASSDELEVTSSLLDGKASPNRQRQQIRPGTNSTGCSSLNSLIASALPGFQHVCVALASCSNGELWQFHCSPTGIQRKKIYENKLILPSQGGDSGPLIGSKGYPRSLIWRFSHVSTDESKREFFLLTDHEIQCFVVNLNPNMHVSKLWSHEIIGTDADLGIKKDLAGQKRIWPLDVQVDDHGKVITILVATFCKDRVSGSSYTQYSLLTMQYKPGVRMEPSHERILEKKAPIQVIIPKARVEDEDFLFSMKLRVGGKPSGSAIILSGDGTATVSHYYRNSTRLYQFDLPYDAGKVLDASVLPSSDDIDEGPWVLLTEKAGIWAIPEKAVVLGGVEPPERSLSRKGSSKEGSAQEEKRNLTFTGNIAPIRASSEACDAAERQTGVLTGIAHRTGQDEESETLLSHLFHGFLSSGQVDGSLEKLQSAGAFERDGETSIFTRMSKSIVDTLAKHWTTTRGAEILAMAVVSTQLMDKQQKHKKFLQFLALSKCHEELCARQRYSLQIILEHGEKLAGMIQLRELQNVIGQNRSAGVTSHSSAESQMSGALWDIIQLVDRHLDYVISIEQPLWIQIQRACELSNVCVNIVHEAMQYRNENHLWYPPPEGLTPWYCQPVVRNGLWSIASFMLQLLNEASGIEMSAKSDLYTYLEVLSEALLEAYSGAITAKVERGEEHKGLLDEFWNRRDTLLDTLYRQVQDFVDDKHQDLNGGFAEPKEEILRKLCSRLLSIAKRHESYGTLWRTCCDLNDSVLLRDLMHESMGPNGGFSYFVFKQLYEKRQFSKLLRLGEEFPEELSIFLRQHQELLWLHEVFLNQFSSASDILHVLALSCDESAISTADEQADPGSDILEPKLADRKRLLNLSKIAAKAAAGKDADSETKLKRIEADLKILKLQEEIIQLLPTDEEKQYAERQLLRPEELIKLCLKGQNAKLSLLAFDVFAWTSSSFRKAHCNLLEECWKNAADQDDWNLLYQSSIAQGWSDEEIFLNLRETMLFQASSRCYGLNVETFGEGFDEVLPLRQENVEPLVLRDIGSSVEAILMQHKDFPEAGKLMLTAVTLGSVQDDTRLEEVPSPME